MCFPVVPLMPSHTHNTLHPIGYILELVATHFSYIPITRMVFIIFKVVMYYTLATIVSSITDKQ